jgi:hypothetical protein
MHHKINVLYSVKTQVKAIVRNLKKDKKNDALVKVGNEIYRQLTQWDEDMVQRKSKAYDDVENFPNKFTAEYLFLINQTESNIPRVDQSSRDRKAELDVQLNQLNSKANAFMNNIIPEFNKQLWDAGIGAIKMY